MYQTCNEYASSDAFTEAAARMGVRGLATYFSNRELFFDEIRLRDCKVVIDGNNLRSGLEMGLSLRLTVAQVCTVQMVPRPQPLLWRGL
jgi:hypothetical protein